MDVVLLWMVMQLAQALNLLWDIVLEGVILNERKPARGLMAFG
jgi:hypothetical protein